MCGQRTPYNLVTRAIRVILERPEMKQWRILLVLLSVVALVLVAHLGYAVLRVGKPKLKRVQDDVVEEKRTTDYVSTVSPKKPIVSTSRRLSNAKNAAENSTGHPSTVKRKRDCWEVEEFQSLSRCVKCSEFKKNAAICHETGSWQLVLCISSKKKAFKSCIENNKSQEENKFWIFEAFMLIVVVCTAVVVRQRQKKLEEMVQEKLKKQMNSDTV